MIKAKYHLLLASLIATSGLVAMPDPVEKKHHDKSFQHNIQLQLADSLGFLVEGTEFWVTINVNKDDSLVTLELPVINFQTGQVSTINPYYPSGEINAGIPPAGGYLFTVDGFLPKEYRPVDLVPRSIVAASNNGMSPVFSFNQDPATLPNPPAGYIVQVTNSGELQIQCAGTFGNIIPAGPQILMPCSITYSVKSTKKSHDDISFDDITRSHDSAKLKHNTKISDGPINVTKFTDVRALATGFRDSQVNDAFDNVVAYSWSDNSMVADQTIGTMNTMVAIGKISKHGKLKMNNPIQITDLPANVMVWTTAIAINRNNPNNIVVSYDLLDRTSGPTKSASCRAVSFDGGKTWGNGTPYTYTSFTGSITGNVLTITNMYNGSISVGDVLYSNQFTAPDPGIIPGTIITGFLTGTGGVGTYTVNNTQNISSIFIVAGQPLNGPVQIEPGFGGGVSDCRGVSADKFGNIWYGISTIFDETGFDNYQPIFAASSDNGVTFEVVYTVPVILNNEGYDYPQYCFGGDGLGNYGLWFQVSNFDQNPGTGDAIPFVGFIPITGLGSFGTPTITELPGLTNAQLESDLAASADGRLWLQAGPWIGAQGPNSTPYSYIQPSTIVFKSPGAQDVNYAGPWDLNVTNANTPQYFGFFFPAINPLRNTTSFIYLTLSVQSIIFDEERQALYALVNPQTPNYSENMQIYFSISRDNGMTWSNPLRINTSHTANRGYQSMALDTETGNLLFGWYDGRNDPTFESVEYYGAVLTAKELDKMVDAIPLSNPTFVVPSAA